MQSKILPVLYIVLLTALMGCASTQKGGNSFWDGDQLKSLNVYSDNSVIVYSEVSLKSINGIGTAIYTPQSDYFLAYNLRDAQGRSKVVNARDLSGVTFDNGKLSVLLKNESAFRLVSSVTATKCNAQKKCVGGNPPELMQGFIYGGVWKTYSNKDYLKGKENFQKVTGGLSSDKSNLLGCYLSPSYCSSSGVMQLTGMSLKFSTNDVELKNAKYVADNFDYVNKSIDDNRSKATLTASRIAKEEKAKNELRCKNEARACLNDPDGYLLNKDMQTWLKGLKPGALTICGPVYSINPALIHVVGSSNQILSFRPIQLYDVPSNHERLLRPLGGDCLPRH